MQYFSIKTCISLYSSFLFFFLSVHCFHSPSNSLFFIKLFLLKKRHLFTDKNITILKFFTFLTSFFFLFSSFFYSSLFLFTCHVFFDLQFIYFAKFLRYFSFHSIGTSCIKYFESLRKLFYDQ